MTALQEAQLALGQMYITLSKYIQHSRTLENTVALLQNNVNGLEGRVKELEEQLAHQDTTEKEPEPPEQG